MVTEDVAPVHVSSGSHQRTLAWRRAALGAFVHWGPSAILGGEWRGEQIEGLSEWIRYRARIPADEYRALAAQFDPTSFDARDWVSRFVDAGARYLVFTAKHHDGFAMYRSRASDFNIVDATPFRRDVLMELAEACRDQGIGLGVYYSQMIDWDDLDATGPRANEWDRPTRERSFDRYWAGKAMPQLRELLTGYGDLASVWFDMAAGMTAENAREALSAVRELQPGAVMNSRLGPVEADFTSMNDNYVDNVPPRTPWELAITTNETWGYSTHPGRWKSTAQLCRTIAHVAARGGNTLLNIGPDGLGAFPETTREQLAGVGEWMRRAAPGIRGVRPSPLQSDLESADLTATDDALYVHSYASEARTLVIPGLLSSPEFVRDLATGASLPHGLRDSGVGTELAIDVPPTTGDLPATVEVAFSAPPEMAEGIQQAGQSPSVLLSTASAHRDDQGGLHWDVRIADAGEYDVVAVTRETSFSHDPQWWADRQRGVLHAGDAVIEFALSDDAREPDDVLVFWERVCSALGTFTVIEPGAQRISLQGLRVVDDKWDADGVNLAGIRLQRRAHPHPHA
ncbi:alpha-L-fucosidase [Microbacterium sp. H1-D42]|uniref:alpha-L-fucosidase n=1 Tax=Microbacterium sp. H1-D42 TaxID=2925844 RepID=UPI001F53CB3D|nr:alpha-L-fucosidase [Microbacterium sp. H1-D42]UNK71277.1 alpha-L-fucosidase [Microbacterium sp. H1-D42]